MIQPGDKFIIEIGDVYVGEGCECYRIKHTGIILDSVEMNKLATADEKIMIGDFVTVIDGNVLGTVEYITQAMHKYLVREKDNARYFVVDRKEIKKGWMF